MANVWMRQWPRLMQYVEAHQRAGVVIVQTSLDDGWVVYVPPDVGSVDLFSRVNPVIDSIEPYTGKVLLSNDDPQLV